ncbi:MAG TPA: hypothetical protein PKL11_05230 [Anaerolineaceae bacterium]|nr:hypothetical protein [Anaerolineaceae bacterium]
MAAVKSSGAWGANLFLKIRVLCYTPFMQGENPHWMIWAQFLQRWGVKEIAAALLEAGGPLNIFMAQLAYAGGPLFSSQQPSGWQALAETLENPQQSRAFAAFLRQEVKA